MTTTTLSKLDSAQLDGSGNGVVTLKPDVGQNWAPLFVRVSAANKTSPIPYCAVFHGSPGVPPQASQFIDDTFLGNGDTSSMIAGTPILFGEAIIFQFQNGTPGDTVTATVYGMTSDLPPNLNLLPQVPGTHFAGHLSTEILSTVSTVSGSSPVTLAGPLTIGPFDARQWGSYYLKAYATTFAAAAVVDIPTVTFTWTSDAAGTDIVFQDQMQWVADSSLGGVYQFNGGFVEFQDIHHGPYLKINFVNASSLGDSLHLNYTLTFTTRVLPLPFQKQQNSISGVLINGGLAVPAGTTVNFPWNFGYGRTALHMGNTGASALNFNRMQGTIGAVEAFNLAAGVTPADREIIMPKMSTWWTVQAPGGSSSFVMYAVSQYDKD